MSRSARTRLCAALLGVAVLGLAACGDDDGGEVRDLNEGSGSGSASGSGSGSAAGSGSGSHASGTEEAACRPVGAELEADATETVDVTLRDYEFDPAEITVAAGVVTFAANNEGSENHELAFLPGGGDIPLTAEGAPDEEALGEAGAFELEAFGPGGTCNATYELEAGTYTLFCIVEAADGETHADKGMLGELTVT